MSLPPSFLSWRYPSVGVLAFATVGDFPVRGVVGNSYVDLSSPLQKVYRWDLAGTSAAVAEHYDVEDAAHYVVVSFADGLPGGGTVGLVYLDADNIGAETPTKTWDAGAEAYVDGDPMAIVTAATAGDFPSPGDTDTTYIDLSASPSDGYAYTAAIAAVPGYVQYAKAA